MAFSTSEKVAIARALDALGVEQIEAGSPAMGRAEQDSLRTLVELDLHADLIAWCRATAADVEAAVACGFTRAHLTIPVSDIQLHHKLSRDRDWARAQIVRTATDAIERGLIVSVGFEDASRADDAFVVELAETLRAIGVVRLRWADTVGTAEPHSLRDRLCDLVRQSPGPWEIHAHNDFGLATANTLTAVAAGFDWVSTTITGLGERAGNAPMEEVAMAATHLLGVDTNVKTHQLRSAACLVASAARRPLPSAKAVVGNSVFAHESGIHVDGVLKCPSVYEPFDPAEVGARRRLVVGKHSGRASVRHALSRSGLAVENVELSHVLDEIRIRATQVKRPLRNSEVRDIYLSAGKSGCS